MRNAIRLHYVLKTNAAQRNYLLHHMRMTCDMYRHSCHILKREQLYHHAMRDEAMMRGLLKEHFHYVCHHMEDKETLFMVKKLMRVRMKVRQHQHISYTYRCVITSPELYWHSLSLRHLVHGYCSYDVERFLYACIYEQHHRLYLDIYIRKEKG